MKELFLIHGNQYAPLNWLSEALNRIAGFKVTVDELPPKQSSRDSLHRNLQALESSDGEVSGRIVKLSVFEAHHWALADRVRLSHSRFNVLTDPLEIVFQLINQYQKSVLDDEQLDLFVFESNRVPAFSDLRNHARYRHNVDITHKDSVFFLRALAELEILKNDLTVPVPHFRHEELYTAEGLFRFVRKIVRSETEITLSEIQSLLETVQFRPNTNEHAPLQSWQRALLTKRLSDLDLISQYQKLGFQLPYLLLSNSETRPAQNPLISIQLNSNRPAQFGWFLDSLEQNAESQDSFEVLVHIDEGDEPMESAVKREISKRPFTIKHVKSDIVKSFGDLWKPLNLLYPKTDPNAYFLLNLADEMLIKTPGWDRIVREYVGYYKDDIFRLRASKFRFRNYTDLWECGYAPDSLTFYTKKWLEAGGEWNPCLGPDSFQQCVAYHLYNFEKHSHTQYNRDIPLANIHFDGEGASIGLSAEMAVERRDIHYKAWFVLMGHEIQEEAARRAAKLQAEIIVHQRTSSSYKVIDNVRSRQIDIVEVESGQVFKSLKYRQSKIRFFLTNLYRRHNYYYFCGGGDWSRLDKRMARLALRLVRNRFAIRFFRMLRKGPVYTFQAVRRKLSPATSSAR